MTDYMYLCYEIHPTDLINGDLFWGFTKSGIINGRNYKWNTYPFTLGPQKNFSIIFS